MFKCILVLRPFLFYQAPTLSLGEYCEFGVSFNFQRSTLMMSRKINICRDQRSTLMMSIVYKICRDILLCVCVLGLSQKICPQTERHFNTSRLIIRNQQIEKCRYPTSSLHQSVSYISSPVPK